MEFKNGKVTKKIKQIANSLKDNQNNYITGTKITFLHNCWTSGPI